MRMHSYSLAHKSSGAFFRVWGRERCRKRAARGRIALRRLGEGRERGVMVNLRGRQVPKKSPEGLLSDSCCNDYFFDDLLGFKSGVFPGVFLLSR